MAITGLTNSDASGALLGHRKHGEKVAEAVGQLSTGSRLNKASSDPSSAAVAATLAGNVSVLKTADGNARNAAALLQLASGFIQNDIDLLNRMKTLAQQATSGALDDSNRALIDSEFQKLITQIGDNATRARWMNTQLLTGSVGAVTEAGAKAEAVTGLTAVANGFLNTLCGAQTLGFVTGTFDSVSVSANNGGAANSYDITVTLRNADGNRQTFKAIAETPTANGALVLKSTSNNIHQIAVNYDAAVTAVSNASTFESSLQTLFGLGSGAQKASLLANSAALTGVNAITAVAAGSQTTAGDFALQKVADSDTLYLTDTAGRQWTATAAASSTVTFDNGVSVTFGSGYARATAIPQGVFTVAQGTGTSLSFQVDVRSTDTVSVSLSPATTSALGISSDNVKSTSAANTALTNIENALTTLKSSLATLGAQQSQMDATQKNLASTIENLTGALSTYRDADVAEALTEFVKADTMSKISFTAISQGLQATKDLASFVRNNG